MLIRRRAGSRGRSERGAVRIARSRGGLDPFLEAIAIKQTVRSVIAVMAPLLPPCSALDAQGRGYALNPPDWESFQNKLPETWGSRSSGSELHPTQAGLTGSADPVYHFMRATYDGRKVAPRTQWLDSPMPHAYACVV